MLPLSRTITRHHTRRCCVIAKVKDVTGMRFGRLMVIERAKNPKNNADRHSYWLCKCDCGNKIIVVGTSLVNGNTKSCGCLSKETKIRDLAGNRYGKLTVIKKVENKLNLKDRCIYWNCICDCGNKKIVKGTSLTRGVTKSCGCLKKDIQYISNNKGLFKSKYNTYDLTGEYGIGYTFKGEPFYFDLEDYNKIKKYCWCLTCGYISNSNHKIRMHRLLMNCKDANLVVDHINHITYDNRKDNLRVCTLSQNGMNKRVQSNNTSGINGVTFDTSANKWRARICVNHNTINLGRFANKSEAINARKEAEKKYFGVYSYEESMLMSNGKVKNYDM